MLRVCYIVSRGVQGEYYSPHAFGEHTAYWRRQTLYSFTNKGFSQDLRSGRVDVEACVFYYVICSLSKQKRLIGLLKAQQLLL